MKQFAKIRVFVALVAAFFIVIAANAVVVPPAKADIDQDKLDSLLDEITQYEQEITKLKNEANTLSNQIAQYDAQITLTSLKISQTVEKIDQLGVRIGALETSLEALTEAFTSRVVKTYKMSRLQEPYLMLVQADELKDAVSSYHYLKKIQEADRDLMDRLESAQIRYETEKSEQEILQEELETQKASLDTQKSVKANLLQVTRSDEKRYQELLAQAKAEYEAIQAVIAGRGDETEVGSVSQGERIASVIQGTSCNSGGTHLHFIVAQNATALNPFTYLKPIDFDNCSGSSCGSGDGDSFNPSGSWEWPIQPKVKLTQGYGVTWAVRNTWVSRIYGSHNGIDVNSTSSSEVKAVQAGTLYQGSYTGYNGCRLKYVRVDHEGSDLETFYLHINY